MEEITRFEHAGRLVRIVYDEDPMNPREEENLGIMVCAHRSYILGDIQLGPGDMPFEIPDDAIGLLHLGLIDHSGISMYVGGGAHPHDPGGWDSGTVGVIYTTAARVKELGLHIEDVDSTLRAEVEVYDRYLRGMFCGFIVEDHEGNQLDSCWGFDDEEYCIEEAKGSAEHNPEPGDKKGILLLGMEG